MSLKINVREREGVTIMDLIGRIVLGDGAEQLSTTARRLVDKGSKKLLINLAKVRYIDSVGLGSLIACYASAKTRSAELKLLNPLERHMNLLVMTKLITVFAVFDDEEEAVKSFVEAMAAQP